MYNLYQSQIWKDIQTQVYNKKSFVEHLFWKDYFWLVHEKKVWAISIKWLQIMWVELPENKEFVKKELKKLKEKYEKEKWIIFIQLCFINEFIRFENCGPRAENFVENIKEMRLNMTDTDAEEFDKFVARHWGEESVYNMAKERIEKSKVAAERANSTVKKTK